MTNHVHILAQGMSCFLRVDGKGVCFAEHPCKTVDMFNQCLLRNEVCRISEENLAICREATPCDLITCDVGSQCIGNKGVGQCHEIGSVCANRTCATGKKCVEVAGFPTCTRNTYVCSRLKTRQCESNGRDCKINTDGSQACVKRPDPCADFQCGSFSRCEAVGKLVTCRPRKCNKVTIEVASEDTNTISTITFAEFCSSDEGGNRVCVLDENSNPTCQKINPCNNRRCPDEYFCSPNTEAGTSQCILKDACKRYLLPGYTMYSICTAANQACTVDETNSPKCIVIPPVDRITEGASIVTPSPTLASTPLLSTKVPRTCEGSLRELCAIHGKVCILNQQGVSGCTAVDALPADSADSDDNYPVITGLSPLSTKDLCERSGMETICLQRNKVCSVSSEGVPKCKIPREDVVGAAASCSDTMIAKCISEKKVCLIVEDGKQRCRMPESTTLLPTSALDLVGCAINNMAETCVERGKICMVLENGDPVCKIPTTTVPSTSSTLDTRCVGVCWGAQTCKISVGGSPICIEQSDNCIQTGAWDVCAKRGRSCRMNPEHSSAECVKYSPCELRTCEPGYMCKPGVKKLDTTCIPVDLCDRGIPSMRSSCARKKQGCRVTENGGTRCINVKECSVHDCPFKMKCKMVFQKNAKHPICLPWSDSSAKEEGGNEGIPYKETRPHIVLFLTDDQGYANVGFKNSNISTPYIDGLVADGVLLNRHYGASWCAPSRASRMSGRMPLRVDHHAMHPGIALLPEVLSTAGYRTAQVGKWHIGKCAKDMTPYERGFTESFGNLGQVHHDLTTDEYCFLRGCNSGVDLWDTFEPAYGKGNKGEYSSYVYSAYIRKFIKGHNSSKPLFMYINPTQPHTPYNAPDEYSQPYLKAGRSASFAIYNGMITAVDDIVGATVNALKSQRMWKNTLFIYASDNGGLTCAADYEAGFASNYPLRGGKLSVLEGGVRSLAFISGGFVPNDTKGSTRDGYVHLADWYPTISKLAGAPQTSDPWGHSAAGIPSIDGFDVWRYLAGRDEESPRNEILVADWRGPGKVRRKAALIQGDFKFVSSNGMIKFGYVSCAGWTGLDETGQASVADLSMCKKKDTRAVDRIDEAERADEIEDELEAEGFVGGDALRNPVCSSGNDDEDLDCTNGCLFNITADPGERFDISSQYPLLLAAMNDRVVSLQKGTDGLDVVRRDPDSPKQECLQTVINGIKTGYMQPFYEHTPFYIRRVNGTPGLPQPKFETVSNTPNAKSVTTTPTSKQMTSLSYTATTQTNSMTTLPTTSSKTTKTTITPETTSTTVSPLPAIATKKVYENNRTYNNSSSSSSSTSTSSSSSSSTNTNTNTNTSSNGNDNSVASYDWTENGESNNNRSKYFKSVLIASIIIVATILCALRWYKRSKDTRQSAETCAAANEKGAIADDVDSLLTLTIMQE